ncbi:MAG: inositol monophosphatase family protein [Gemmatimonadaceae bacterium]
MSPHRTPQANIPVSPDGHAAREGVLGVAITAAQGAAAVIRSHAADAAALEWREKSPADFVSAADMAAEETIREVLHRDAPGAAVIGEELSPNAQADAALAFIVDPLDGTVNFLHGYPAYAVSIAVLADGALAAAVIVNVPSNDVYTATAGAGAWRNGERLRVSSVRTPARALVGTGFPFKHLHLLDRYQRQFAAVMRATAGIRRAGSAALDLADVASGRFDAFWELALAPWDFAAGLLLVREAGGVVSDADGHDVPFSHGAVVAGNPDMHAWLLRELQSSA